MVSNRNLLFQGSIFRGYVSLPEGNPQKTSSPFFFHSSKSWGFNKDTLGNSNGSIASFHGFGLFFQVNRFEKITAHFLGISKMVVDCSKPRWLKLSFSLEHILGPNGLLMEMNHIMQILCRFLLNTPTAARYHHPQYPESSVGSGCNIQSYGWLEGSFVELKNGPTKWVVYYWWFRNTAI